MSLVNKSAPQFSLPSTEGGNIISLGDFKNQKVVLVFYPGDDTPVCTKQLCSYATGFEDFSNKGIVLLGINQDTLESHLKFKSKYKLPFPLLSDTDGKVCSEYGAKGLLGTKRATFIINEKGIITYEDFIFPFFFRNKTDIFKQLEK